MLKSIEFQKELIKLTEIFKDVEESKQKLVEGLIREAAFIYSENIALRESLEQTGMVKVHPTKPDMQKPLDTAKQYLKNVGAYAIVIKTLNGVLQKNQIEQDDEFDKFIEEMRQNE